jgi:hypothetical protein
MFIFKWNQQKTYSTEHSSTIQQPFLKRLYTRTCNYIYLLLLKIMVCSLDGKPQASQPVVMFADEAMKQNLSSLSSHITAMAVEINDSKCDVISLFDGI